MHGQTQHAVQTEGFAATQGRDVAATRGGCQVVKLQICLQAQLVGSADQVGM